MCDYAHRKWNLGKRPITVESFYVLLQSAYDDGIRDGQKAENRRSMRVVNAYLNGKIQMMGLKERMLHRPKPRRERRK